MTAPEPEQEPEREPEPGPENAEQPFPATGAHWLEGWVVFGNAYP